MSISTIKLSEDTWEVIVRGRLDHDLNPQLEAELNDLWANEKIQNLIINLAETSYINSGGLRYLVAAWRRFKQRGGQVVLCELNSRLLEIFQMVGFDKVFHIYPTCKKAHKLLLKA
jgi:anti-sigma B factor antagonist